MTQQFTKNIHPFPCHIMQRSLATRKLPVRLSVQSVKRVICDKMKERCAQIFIPHERLLR